MGDVVVRGARTHNLRDVDVTFPRDRLVVLTGVSGSGKSSLAFDTLYAEAQRRFVESLSVHARQMLDRLPKPDVDLVEGLSPAICVEQQPPTRNPRSTVGTVTEVHDYLRLLFARVGEPHCPHCGRPVSASTVQEIVDRVLSLPDGTRFGVLAPIVSGKRGALGEELERLRREGFVRARLDGETIDLGGEIKVDGRREHTLEVFVDRLSVKSGIAQRLTESVELALKLGGGLVRIAPALGEEQLHSERFACPTCGFALPDITPRLFSFNSPEGACPECDGLGEKRLFEAALVVPDETRSLAEGAVAAWGKPGGSYHRHMLEQVIGALPVDPELAWEELPAATRRRLLEGGDGFEGILPGLERRMRDYERRRREEGANEEATFEYLQEEIGRFATRRPCPTCKGARLNPTALAVTLGGRNIRELSSLPLRQARDALASLELDVRRAAIAAPVVREVAARLGFLVDVGVDYLTLDRGAATLSAGEAQRIRLATQIGAGLVGVLYVLDEPSIGLHPRDTAQLLETLLALRDRGSSVVVVEHDLDVIRAADHVVDVGPGAGKEGGRVVASAPPAEIAAHPTSVTGAFLSGRRAVPRPARRRAPRGAIRIEEARIHNLRDVAVEIPLRVLTVVTGVSGSGKSSLVMDTLVPALRGRPAPARVRGHDAIDKVIDVTQAPIGRTPRSNPASYVSLFAELRALYAELPEARARGYAPGRFSFNKKGGRCEACQGDGLVRIEMHFLPDVYVRCDVCGGRRYNRETLEIRYRGVSIADVLEMSVDDAHALLSAFPRCRERLDALRAVGLGYLELGRSATTLSGGEAQRVRLARELARRAGAHTLYVLDEPTTGLHPADVELLVHVLGQLVEAGHTVVVIEHNLDVVKVADHVIDLGPEGGDGGGRVVASGTPEQVAAVAASHTGRLLAHLVRAPLSG